MIGPQPESIANTLFAELESLFSTDTPAEELQLLRLKRAADNLAKIDFVSGSFIRAGIAALKWDAPATEMYISQLLSRDNSRDTLGNVALTFKILNKMSKAADYAVQMANFLPSSIAEKKQAIAYLIANGRLSEAYAFATMHSKNADLEKDIKTLSLLQDTMKSLEIKEEQLQLELELAYSILSQKRIRYRNFEWEISHDPDGGQALICSIFFFGDINIEMAIEADLADLLSQQSSWNPTRLSVEFHYETVNDLQFA